MNVSAKFQKIHRMVEGFFEARKKEATWAKTVILLLLVGFFQTLYLLLEKYEINFDIISMVLRHTPERTFYSVLSGTIQFALLILVSALLVWGIGKLVFKGKGTFVQISYLILASFIVILLAPFLLLPFTVMGLLHPLVFLLLNLVFRIFGIYLNILSIKIAHTISYGQAVVMAIASGSIIGVIVLVLFFAGIDANLHASPKPFSYDITNHADGSFTIEYNWNRGEEVCSVTFPVGWSLGEEDQIRKITGRYHNNSKYYLIVKNENEYFDFDIGPPENNRYKLGNIFETYNRLKNNGDYLNNRNFRLDSFQLVLNEENGALALDRKFIATNQTIVKHEVSAWSVYDLGFTAYYYHPPSEDGGDLQYILNNFECDEG